MKDASKAWRTWLSEDAQDVLINAALKAHPKETGGVLIGVLTGKRPWVTYAIEVKSEKSGLGYYELPRGSRREMVAKLRNQDSRLGYLGDWHSHPIDIAASTVDLKSVASLVVTGDCPRPLLFIIRHTDNGYAIDGRQWSNRTLRQLRIISAGPLPPQQMRKKRMRRVISKRQPKGKKGCRNVNVEGGV